mmetsp:Transcript_37269/g.94671  ORF Transcript_37269/g.94671 Transcript_37269/m.94671 type:complete len:242 (-) Transcript_37269:786-1511(-)
MSTTPRRGKGSRCSLALRGPARGSSQTEVLLSMLWPSSPSRPSMCARTSSWIRKDVGGVGVRACASGGISRAAIEALSEASRSCRARSAASRASASATGMANTSAARAAEKEQSTSRTKVPSAARSTRGSAPTTKPNTGSAPPSPLRAEASKDSKIDTGSCSEQCMTAHVAKRLMVKGRNAHKATTRAACSSNKSLSSRQPRHSHLRKRTASSTISSRMSTVWSSKFPSRGSRLWSVLTRR